jgi:hypothetical protein
LRKKCISNKKVKADAIKEPVIQVKNKNSQWVALDIIDNTVISEGVTTEEVTKKAQVSGKMFMLMFVPKKGETYIF